MRTKMLSNLIGSLGRYPNSNGRELVRRVRDFRPTWDLKTNESISSNYYPITTRITIQDTDENLELAVLTDRAEGGSSLKAGEIELMVHRNSIKDDGFGVNEPLQDQAFGEGLVVRGTHYVIGGHITGESDTEPNIVVLEREVVERKLLDAWVFLSSPGGESYDDYKANHILEYQGLKSPLPENVHILTLEPWKESSFLLRLEHAFAVDEDSILSEPVTVNIEDIFTAFTITSLQETTLGANQLLKDNDRLKFKPSGVHEEQKESKKHIQAPDDFEITLNPMQIRTFIVEVKLNNQKI